MAVKPVIINQWQLKKGYVFVDAYGLEDQPQPGNLDRHPKKLPHAHIMKTSGDYEYIAFNDYAAFILRFIIMGLDAIAVIPKIIASEYANPAVTEAQALDDIKAVLGMTGNYTAAGDYTEDGYLEKRTKNRKRAIEPSTSGKCPGGYDLDFSVHSIGPGFLKGPF